MSFQRHEGFRLYLQKGKLTNAAQQLLLGVKGTIEDDLDTDSQLLDARRAVAAFSDRDRSRL